MAPPGAGARSARQSLLRAALLATLAYAAYAVFLTWPLASDPAGLLPGPADWGDRVNGIAQMAYLLAHHVSPFAPAVLHGFNAPEGLSQGWVFNWVSFPSELIIYGLSLAFGATAGANVFLWLSFVLSGLSMFLLCRRLFGHGGAAFLAGFAFAFFPFATAQIGAHPIYMDGAVFVLIVWRMLELIETPTRRNGLLAGAATALAMWWTPYFILFALVVLGVLGVVGLAVGRVRRDVAPVGRALAVAALPIGGLIVGLGLLSRLGGGGAIGAVRTNNIHDLFAYSARWADWLLPDRFNLLFGGVTSPYLNGHLHGSNFGENSLYLGISVLALAGVGVVAAARAIRRRGRRALEDRGVTAVVAAAALVLVSAAFAAPPMVRILGIPIVMPSGVVFLFTSTWRVFERFVEVTELGLCIALAYGIGRLLQWRGRPARLALLGLAGAVLVLDLWARPPVRTTPAQPPAEYVWLAHHPGGTVADYPLLPADSPDYEAALRQTQDGHPLLNGYASGSDDETLKLGLVDLRDPRTAGGLAALGVRYVVVHPGQPIGTRAEMERRGYVLRTSARDGSVWQVTAPVPAYRVDEAAGFGPVLGRFGAQYRWVSGPARLNVVAPHCGRCRVEVSFRSRSSEVARLLTVTDAVSGRVLTRVRVPVARLVPVRVVVGLQNRSAPLVLSTDVPPQWPRIPGWSPESVSVQGLTVARLSGTR